MSGLQKMFLTDSLETIGKTISGIGTRISVCTRSSPAAIILIVIGASDFLAREAPQIITIGRVKQMHIPAVPETSRKVVSPPHPTDTGRTWAIRLGRGAVGPRVQVLRQAWFLRNNHPGLPNQQVPERALKVIEDADFQNTANTAVLNLQKISLSQFDYYCFLIQLVI